MTSPTHGSADCCDDLSELVAWYPNGSLEVEERRRVEAHVATCAACADILQFATATREVTVALATAHPEPEQLVAFAEDALAIAAAPRADLHAHLAICDCCATELATLQQIDRLDASNQLAGSDSAEGADSAVPTSRQLVGGLRDWWSRLLAAAAQPAPAIYLAGAAAVILVLLLQPGDRLELSAPGGSGGLVSGVVLLPDDGGTLRGGEVTAAPLTEIDGEQPPILLLELTNLITPPPPDDLYRIVITGATSSNPVWNGVARGAVFEQTYTLCLMLEPGTLAVGQYRIAVLDPDGTPVYRAPLVVR